LKQVKDDLYIFFIFNRFFNIYTPVQNVNCFCFFRHWS